MINAGCSAHVRRIFTPSDDMDATFIALPDKRAVVHARTCTIIDFYEAPAEHFASVAELLGEPPIAQTKVGLNWPPALSK
jgi:hypothetical protein